MRKLKLLCGVATASLFIPLSSAGYAQDATLDAVVVTAESEGATGTQTVPSNDEAREIIQKTPGGVAVVGSENFEHVYALSFEDTLALTAGVYAQKRFAEEVRLSIRGSGLSRGFHLRGVMLLQDGIPFNQADGAGDFQEADALTFQRLEVYKGANALEFGSTTLGGAINMVSKTGQSHPGGQVTLEAGSYNTFRTNLQYGKSFDNKDIFLSLTGTKSDGFRDHSDQENIKFNGNFGIQISKDVETRFYLSANTIDQQLPGSLSLDDALNNPKSASFFATPQDWRRDIDSIRFANKTSFKVGDDYQIDVGAFVSGKELFHPITAFVGVIDHKSINYGLFAKASGEYHIGNYRNRYAVGVTSHFGHVEAKRFANVNGSRGALTANADQDAANLTLYGENHFYFTPSTALVTGGQLTWARREYTDHLDPTEDDSRIYKSFNPKVGLLYEHTDKIQFFANISRSDETPTFSELTQGGTVGFTPVDSQKAWTAEIGSRGEYGRFSWDVSVYRAWLKDEMLQFSTANGAPASTFNADETIHQGVELGFGVRLADDLFTAGDSLKWRNAYTYSDYYFVDDNDYQDNAIPGQPKHFYQTELRYQKGDLWHVAVNWEYASDAYVDFANTLKAPSYGVVGMNAGYKIDKNIDLYLDARNLTDEKYVSTFSTIIDQNGNTSVFHPGEGRSLFGGIRMKF